MLVRKKIKSLPVATIISKHEAVEWEPAGRLHCDCHCDEQLPLHGTGDDLVVCVVLWVIWSNEEEPLRQVLQRASLTTTATTTLTKPTTYTTTTKCQANVFRSICPRTLAWAQ